MKMNVLQKKRALCTALLALLLSVVGVTKTMAQTPYRQYADNGVLLNFHEIDNVDFRVFLLYSLSQDDRFILVENEESGQFSILSNGEEDASGFLDAFESFYQNAYADFGLLSKTELATILPVWKSQINPRHFASIMMDITLRNTRSDNEHCINADPFCTSDIIEFEAASSGIIPDEAADYGCIYTPRNPSWYFLRIADPGQFIIHMEGTSDVDFCLWGPFDDLTSACDQLSSDKIIDCSYSPSLIEDAFLGYQLSEHNHGNYSSDSIVNYHVPQTGEYYLLMITNYSNQSCYVTLSKTDGSGPGTTELPSPIVSNGGPYCVGETIDLHAIAVDGVTYNWTGPNNWTNRFQNPMRRNCTMAMAGPYICTITKNGQSVCDTTWVEVYPKPIAGFTATNVDVGQATQFNCTSTTNPSGYNISSYEWDFGDGQTASGATLSHTYANAGIYPVTLTVSTGYCVDEITQNVTVNVVQNAIINFADANVKDLCVANWDANGDGELSYAEAATVTDLGSVFYNKNNITSFDELQYFTGVTSIGSSAFYYCTGLTSIVLPNSVTSIGSNAFYYCTGLTSIEIPNSVTSIGSNAFYYCTGLTSIEIPNSVTSIGNYAFSSCTGLTSIVIPNSVSSIGTNPFSGCSGLEQVVVVSGNAFYDSRGNCNAIIRTSNNLLVTGCKNTIIPNSVTSIGERAFYYCSGLTSIVIPNSVTWIGERAFYYCSGLTSIVIPNSVTSIGNNAFSSCTGLTSIEIPNSVTSIGNSAFSSCTGLTSIVIPNSVTSIGSSAFSSCTGLTSIAAFPETPPTLGNNAFYGVPIIIPVYVPCGEVASYQTAEGWNSFYNITGMCAGTVSVTINPSGGGVVTGAGNYNSGEVCVLAATPNPGFVFGNWTENGRVVSMDSVYSFYAHPTTLVAHFCSDSPINFADANVKALCVSNWDANGDGELSYAEAAVVTDLGTVFKSKNNITCFDELQYFIRLTSIGSNAFYYCSGLTSIVLPNSVTSIGSYAFSSCTGLTSIMIPNSVTTIGNYAFSSCTGLTSIMIPNSVTTIGSYAFQSCSGLTSIVIPNSVSSIGTNPFLGCSGLEQVVVVSGNAFYDSRDNCNAIIRTSNNLLVTGCKNTIIPNSVTSIGYNAFSSCSGLTSIEIPNSVTSIGSSAFSSCSGLTSIEIPNSVTSIGSSAFYYCTGLTSIEIPNSVTSIGDYAFYCCTGLTLIVIPNSVTSIGSSAFSSCSGLTSVEIPNSVISIGSSAFSSCTGLTSIEIPSSVTRIYERAFSNCTGLTSMTVLTDNPPTLYSNAFYNVSKSIPVYVPCGTEAYQSASGWSEFTNFIALDEPIQTEVTVTECDSYTWHGTQYTTSGTYTYETTTAQGCLRIETLHLTINNTFYVDTTAVACDAYTWNGNTLTCSGDYEHLFASMNGCDSIVTLHLTINQSEEEWEYVTECDQYTWHGTTYNTPGTHSYTWHGTTTLGCDRTEHLSITINHADDVTLDPVTECDSYVFDGVTYTQSQVITTDRTDSNGCHYTETLNLTISEAVHNEWYAESCNSYTWNNETYYETGDYEQTLTTAQGCDSIVTLHLTISEAVHNEWYAESCNSYTWNGETYYETGDYEQTMTTVQGCDSIVTLNLTINYSEEEEYNVTECDTYTWANNGQTYTSSGTYVNNITTAQGCPRTETLNLTINYSEEEDFNVTECDTYTWANNGQTYTTSGIYVYNTTTAQGCPRTETLHLTINNSEWEEYTVTANDSYTWHGTTYTESGTYYYEITTYDGCTRIEVLDLTIETNHWTPVGEGSSPFSMTLYGIIQIDGVEQYSDQLELGIFCGNECRGTAMASEFFLTHRYLVEANVYGDSGEQLTFKLYDHGLHQELDLTPPDAITFTIDGYGNPINPYVLNFISSVDITASVSPLEAGTITGTGDYSMGATCTLTATANSGFQFQNWTLDGTVVSTNPTYTFTVTGAANYVAHFQYVQSRDLVAGWNWWSTYIEQQGSNGLEMLENSLGTSGIRIQGKNSSVDYFEYQGTGYWYGALNATANEQMYMIRTSAACNSVIVGDAALPENHPITINSGWNWIGFPSSQSVSVETAMAGFSPEPNDVIKGRSNASMYLSYGGYQGWYGQLNTLEPGQGYMYKSNGFTQKTLTFQTGRAGESLADNITPERNIFVPNVSEYAYSMMVTTVIDVDGQELRGNEYELAAFVGDECRGSVKLMYVEPIDRYVALLLVYGETEEDLRFVLTDGRSVSSSNDRITFEANGTLGTLTEPTVLHFGALGVEEIAQKPIHVYPNPSKGMFNIEGEDIQKIEVVDAYGQVILSKAVENGFVQVNLGDKAAGVYLLRVVTNGGIVTNKLVKK